MSDPMRTFIELALPADVRESIRLRRDALRRTLKQHGMDSCFRWTSISSVHLTLRFLGGTSLDQTRQLSTGLRTMVEKHSAIRLTLNDMGCFPNAQRPRVLWLGIEGELNQLGNLQTKVEDLVYAVGFEAETRPYSPHLTIARVQGRCSRDEVTKAVTLLQRRDDDDEEGQSPSVESASGAFFTVDRLVHMRSDLRPSGPIYTPLSEYVLTG